MIPIGLDCETAPTEPGCMAPPLACVAIGADSWQTVLHHTDWVSSVVQLLEDPQVLIVGHYIAYDFAVLCNEVPSIRPLVFNAYEADRITCTQTRQKLCDIAGGIYRGFDDVEDQTVKLNYALEDLALRHLGETMDKDTWRMQYGALRKLPLRLWPQGSIDYPKNDIRVSVKVHDKQETNAYFLADQFRQARASFWIRLMAVWGIRTDERGVNDLAKRTQGDYDKIAADLRAAGLLWGDKVRGKKSGKPGSRNVGATRERVVRAYAALGKEVPLTDGGKSGNRQPCTDRVTLEESGDPTLIKYADLSSLSTVLTKDIPMLRAGVRIPIHSTFEDLVESGRTSSRKPNLQNQRRSGGVRECFVPRCLECGQVGRFYGGWCVCGAVESLLWSCDYGGLELCTLAQACLTILKKSRLAQALNEGIDPHLLIASQVLRRPYDELKRIKKAGAGVDCRARFGACQCAYCVVDHARQVGKVANFGFPGGLGPDALVFFALNNYDVHLTPAEARNLKKIWLQTWPEMAEYFRWISTHTDRPFPQIEQLFSGRFRGGVRFTEACNTIFQGLGADIAKAAGWLIFRAMYDATVGSVLYGSRCVLMVHDEYVGESPAPVAHECALEVRNLMLKAARPWLPDVKIDVEPALMRRYSKEAKPKYDDGGRLIPWAA